MTVPTQRSAPHSVPELEQTHGIDAQTSVPSAFPQGAPPPASGSPGTPWADSQLWILQLVILALFLIRLAVTVAFHLDTSSLVVEFSTLALFVIPVAYAALTYGLPGALMTAAWVTVLAVPRFLVAVSQHDPIAAWAEVLQIIVLDGLAVLIGQRVSSEREARRQADSAREAHLQAEVLYRELFDSNTSPILIINGDGYVVEANAAAAHTFGDRPASGAAERLIDVVGAGTAGSILSHLLSLDPGEDAVNGSTQDSEDARRVRPLAFEVDGRPVLYRPSTTLVGPPGTDRRMQVIFQDVTAETRRHDLMEAFAGQVVLAQEEERRHIAQELHDGPLQALIHLCRQIDVIQQGDRVDATSLSDPNPLGSLRATVEDTVVELRTIARGLRPSILDDLGLVASINQIVTEAVARQPFEGSFCVNGNAQRLDPTIELALFRIAQEAMNNVERHADALHVAVELDFEPHGILLKVRDDGLGFDSGSDRAGAHTLGLPGMRERAHLIGATFVVASHVHAGTNVEVWVPDDALRSSGTMSTGSGD